jgi:hypothetical protein
MDNSNHLNQKNQQNSNQTNETNITNITNQIDALHILRHQKDARRASTKDHGNLDESYSLGSKSNHYHTELQNNQTTNKNGKQDDHPLSSQGSNPLDQKTISQYIEGAKNLIKINKLILKYPEPTNKTSNRQKNPINHNITNNPTTNNQTQQQLAEHDKIVQWNLNSIRTR